MLWDLRAGAWLAPPPDSSVILGSNAASFYGSGSTPLAQPARRRGCPPLPTSSRTVMAVLLDLAPHGEKRSPPVAAVSRGQFPPPLWMRVGARIGMLKHRHARRQGRATPGPAAPTVAPRGSAPSPRSSGTSLAPASWRPAA